MSLLQKVVISYSEPWLLACKIEDEEHVGRNGEKTFDGMGESITMEIVF